LNSILNFQLTLKIDSNLTNIDISYNKIANEYLVDMIQHLPYSQMELLNISNCFSSKNKVNSTSQSFTNASPVVIHHAMCSPLSMDEMSYQRMDNLVQPLTKFISTKLTSISLRNYGFDNDSSQKIIKCLTQCCKQLKCIDLSYNSFEIYSIRELFGECQRLEEAHLVNDNKLEDYESNWLEPVRFKFEQIGNVPFNCLELKLNSLEDKNDIFGVFTKKWQTNSIKIYHYSKYNVKFKVI
jgi:hypothetical protein